MGNAHQLAIALGRALEHGGLKITTVESCTGGGVAQAITSVAGSSAWFDMGFVTYSNAAKQSLVGVREATLNAHGAVSETTVREMALGALDRANADIAIATSGIAGPGGGSLEKPVGTVWFAWAFKINGLVKVDVECLVFAGDRAAVQASACEHAIKIAEQKVLDCCM